MKELGGGAVILGNMRTYYRNDCTEYFFNEMLLQKLLYCDGFRSAKWIFAVQNWKIDLSS